MGETHPHTLTVRRALALSLRERQAYSKAHTLFADLHKKRLAVCGGESERESESHAEALLSLHDYARSCEETADYALALQNYRKLHKILQRERGAENALTQQVLKEMSRLPATASEKK